MEHSDKSSDMSHVVLGEGLLTSSLNPCFRH